MLILLQHQPSRLIGFQDGGAAFFSVCSLVNIPEGSFSRGLPIILLFNPNCSQLAMMMVAMLGDRFLVVVSTASD